MFALREGVMPGLWSHATVEPTPGARPGAGEIAFTTPDRGAVEAMHRAWRERGIAIAQAPTAMDFGYTFTALDPDGHRLRVFVPEMP